MVHDSFIIELQKLFQENTNQERAKQQAAYMKHKFSYFGLTSPQRRKLQKPFLAKQFLPSKEIAFQICKELWLQPQREFHYFSQELVSKYQNQIEKKDLKLFEWMITHNSWWDTIDFIAPTLVGNYFLKFPEMRQIVLDKWLHSNNIWLQRSCLLFQLKYKSNTDTYFLKYCIENLIGSKEFFINKAIGWILRQYSRTDANWVIDFVNEHPNLANLSKKEALRLLK